MCVKVRIGNLKTKVEAAVVPRLPYDVVLGSPWLSLNHIVANFATRTITRLRTGYIAKAHEGERLRRMSVTVPVSGSRSNSLTGKESLFMHKAVARALRRHQVQEWFVVLVTDTECDRPEGG